MVDFAQAAGIVEPSNGGRVAVTVPNSFAIRKGFADMRAAMAIDAHSRATAGHDWFQNRAGGMEQFNKLQEHVLNPNFAGDASFSKEAVDRLRSTMSASNYNAAEVERQVKGLVTNAALQNAPVTGPTIPSADSEKLKTLIETGKLPAAETQRTPPVQKPPAPPR